jgi:hypothetical protein
MTENFNTQSSSDVHLHEQRDGDKRYVIHPGDNDIFVRTGRQIIDACQLRISLEVWYGEFAEMLEFVNTWCGQNADFVRCCVCTTRAARVMLFFAPKSKSFDFDLEDKLTDLDIQISGKFSVGTVELGQIPFNEIDRFVVIEDSKQVYGECPGSSPAVGTQPQALKPA